MAYRSVLLLATVALWWIANTIASISSKRVMIGEDHATSGSSSWIPAFEDLRWVDLTVLQLLVGGVLATLWLRGPVHHITAPFHQSDTSRRDMITAICGHVVGNLATNAAYAAMSSSTTQVIKAFEPVFTFILLRCLYLENKVNVNFLIPISISLLTMSLGASVFVSGDATFNIWGASAAIASNIAFAVCNLSLKASSKYLENPLQKYAILSTYGGMIILPLSVAKLLLTMKFEWLGYRFRAQDTIVSSLFHFLYNIASMLVLQTVSPLSHAILNLSKRMFVILANIVYFAMPLSWKICSGLLVFATGLALYHFKSSFSRRIRLPLMKVALISITLSFLFIMCISIHVLNTSTRHSVNVIPADCNDTITTAWVFAEAMPEDTVANIEAMWAQNQEKCVVVQCGTNQCMRTIQNMMHPSITSQFLIISNIVKDTPLEVWFNRHPLNKILAGAEFEHHLHDVVHLAMQWHYGGMYFNPTVRINNVNFSSYRQPWISVRPTVPAKFSFDKPSYRLLELSNFPPHHPFVHQLAEAYIRQYPKKGGTDELAWPIVFDFQIIVWNLYRKSCTANNDTSCPTAVMLQVAEVKKPKGSKVRLHFGTLSYDRCVRTTKVANLGDEIQGFPGLHFLPYLDTFLDREALDESKGSERITVFFNAWWGDAQTSWPPPDNIDPILLSIHIAPLIKPTIKRGSGYFQSKAPVGCRDTDTMEYLQNVLGVDTFFSGCLTLLMKNPNIGNNFRTGTIYLVDVRSDIKALLPVHVLERAIAVEHNMKGSAMNNSLARFTAAYELIEMYSRASVVITQRIHAALPCVAMGTPVIFISSPDMPGGGGTITKASSRTAGLTPLFHTLDLYNKSNKEAKSWLHTFNWQSPPPNPNVGMLMRLRATAWDVIRQRNSLYDAAHKFGLLPLSIPTHTAEEQLLFHLIFTTSLNDTIVLNNGKNLSGYFNWRHLRSIESIFYHHPLANVIIHSNTLQQHELDVLTEAGYSIEVKPYNLAEMVNNTPAHTFSGECIRNASMGKFWYSHESDLLRLLVLYKFGGVYIDTDVILVRSFEDLVWNVVAWEDSEQTMLNNAVMKFEKGHMFLGLCLKEFSKNYNGSIWGANGPRLLTRVWKEWLSRPASNSSGNSTLNILSNSAFYAFAWNEVETHCFKETSDTLLQHNMKTVKEAAYAVHLNSKVTGMEGIGDKLKKGTVCKYLLNKFCVFCNRLH